MNLRLFFMLLFFILFSSNSYALPTREKEDIRNLIEGNQFEKAKSQLESLKFSYPNSSSQIELLYTELIISQAEYFYKKQKFLSSYKLFIEASKNWATHPLVQLRLSQMKDKVLTDSSPLNYKDTKIPLEQEHLRDESHDTFLLSFSLQSQEIRLVEMERRIHYLYLIVFACLVSNLFLLFGKPRK